MLERIGRSPSSATTPSTEALNQAGEGGGGDIEEEKARAPRLLQAEQPRAQRAVKRACAGEGGRELDPMLGVATRGGSREDWGTE